MRGWQLGLLFLVVGVLAWVWLSGLDRGAPGREPQEPASLPPAEVATGPSTADRDATDPTPAGEPTAVGEVAVELGELAGVAGTVRDGDGRPVPGAVVQVRAFVPAAGTQRERGWRAPEATSDARGEYSLLPLPPGDLELVAVHPAHADELVVLELAAGQMLDGIDFVLQAGARICGHVLDERGEPIVAAEVAARRRVGGLNRRAESRRVTQTAADGSFCVDGLDPAEYGVRASHPDHHGGSRPESPETLVMAGVEDLSIMLARGATVSGVVLDPAGARVAGARVCASPALAALTSVLDADPSEPLGAFAAESDAGGRFELRGVPAMPVGVFATAPGYQPSDVRTLDLAPAVTATVELTLAAGLLLEGRVIDGSGHPLQDVQLAVEQTGARRGGLARDIWQGGSTTSDAEGRFTFGGLRAGAVYVIAASKKGYGLDPELAARKYSAGAGDVVLTMLASCTVRGRVADGDGAPVATTVSALNVAASKYAGHAKTAADGTYVLEELPAGTLMLTCRSQRHYLAESLELELVPGEAREGADLRLLAGESLTGVAQDDEQLPVEGVLVSCHAPVDMGQAFTARDARTGEDGTFEIAGLPPVELSVSIHVPEGMLQPDDMTPLHARPGDHLILRLSRGAALIGRVVDGDGAPVPQFRVVASYTLASGRGVAHPRRQFSSADGSFSFAGLPPTLFLLAVEADGFAQTTVPVTGFPSSGSLDVGTLTLMRGASVAGVVRGDGGAPMAGATVTVTSIVDGLVMPSVEQRTTGADGRFAIPGLATGGHELVASSAGYQPAELELTLSDAEERDDIELQLVRGGAIFGHVTMPALDTDRIAEIRYRLAGGAGGIGNAPISPSGDYRIDGLAGGSYEVTLFRLPRDAREPLIHSRVVTLPTGGEVRCDFTADGMCRVFGVLRGWDLAEDDPALFPISLIGPGGSQQALLAADGRFEFPAVLPGAYDLHLARLESRPVEVPPASEYELDLELAAGRIAGRVLAPEGSDLGQARVAVWTRPAEGERARQVAVVGADSDGAFVARHLAPGGYELTAYLAGVGESAALAIELGPAERSGGAELVIAGGGRVHVRVVDGSGRPIEWAHLLCADESGAPKRMATARPLDGEPGVYEVQGLAAGRYRIFAGSEAHGCGFTDGVAVPSGGVTNATVTLPEGCAAHVTVLRDGAPVARQSVLLCDLEGRVLLDATAEFRRNPYHTNERGECQTGRFPPGSYLLRVGPSSQPLLETELVLPPDRAVVSVELTIP